LFFNTIISAALRRPLEKAFPGARRRNQRHKSDGLVEEPMFDKEKIKRIVVIRLDKVGDLILSTPFLRNLRENFPHAHIAVVVTPYTEQILEGNRRIDEIRVYDGKWPRRQRDGFRRDLRRGEWDCAVALSPVTEAYRLAHSSGAPHRFGYVYSRRWLARLLSGSLLTHALVFKIDESLERGEKIPHEVEQTLLLLHEMGCTTVEHQLEISLNKEMKELARKDIGEWARGKKIIGIHLSSKWLTAPWILEDFVTMVRGILAAHVESTVLITYGEAEGALARSVIPLLKDEARLRLEGNLAFKDWAALISACDLFISTDTGALHCAVAAGLPVIGVYEGKNFGHCSQQWAPWKVSHLMVQKDMPSSTSEEIRKGVEVLLQSGRSL
jgi:heptosyltransferase II